MGRVLGHLLLTVVTGGWWLIGLIIWHIIEGKKH